MGIPWPSRSPAQGHRSRTLLPPPFGRALAIRTAVVWLGIHVAAAGTLALMGQPVLNVFRLRPYALLWLWGCVVAAVLLDMRTRNEHLILANLGVSARRVGLLSCVECAILESLAILATLGGVGAFGAGG